MKLTINPKEIAPDLKKVERVISSKNIVAILSNFLLEVKNGTLNVTAFDNLVRVTTTMPIVSSDGDFSFCVDAHKFAQAIGNINSDIAEIEIVDNMMVCKHKRGKFNLSYYDGKDYPTMVLEDGKCVLIPVRDIRPSIDSVAFAVSNDDLHPTMCGVYFDCTKDGIVGVGTDARILAKYSNDDGKDYSELSSIIIPLKAANVISSFMERCSDDDNIEVTSTIDVTQLKIDSKWTISFRQINGKYPNYNAVIPQKTNNNATISRKDLIDALNSAVLFAPQKTVTIKFHFSNNKVELEAQDMDYNMSSIEEIECEYDGEEMTIGFNGLSFLSILSSMLTDFVCVNLNTPQRAALVYPKDDVNFLSLIMPVMI